MSQTIYQRLAAAVAECGALSKETKPGIRFSYHGHANVTSLVKSLLTKHGILQTVTVLDEDTSESEIYRSPKNPTRTDILSRVEVLVRYTNVERPEDYIELVGVGHGTDQGDKAPGKAISYAVKYVQLKLFHISEAEEDDNEASAAPTSAPAPAPAPAVVRHPPELLERLRLAAEKAGESPASVAQGLMNKHGAPFAKLMEAQIKAECERLENKPHTPAPAPGAPVDDDDIPL